MIETDITPERIVQYKTVDQFKSIAEAEVYEHIHLGKVIVYGNENTTGNFIISMAENLNSSFELFKSIPFKKLLMLLQVRKKLRRISLC